MNCILIMMHINAFLELDSQLLDWSLEEADLEDTLPVMVLFLDLINLVPASRDRALLYVPLVRNPKT
jgi:hypothetical protein